MRYQAPNYGTELAVSGSVGILQVREESRFPGEPGFGESAGDRFELILDATELGPTH